MATQRAEQFNSNGRKNIKKINKQEKNGSTADLAIPLTDAFSLPPLPGSGHRHTAHVYYCRTNCFRVQAKSSAQQSEK